MSPSPSVLLLDRPKVTRLHVTDAATGRRFELLFELHQPVRRDYTANTSAINRQDSNHKGPLQGSELTRILIIRFPACAV